MVRISGTIIIRHSRSKADSFLAWTFIVLLAIFFESASVLIGDDLLAVFLSFNYGIDYYFMIVAAFLFVFFTALSVNLVNIYLTSACWETISKKSSGPKLFTFVGIIGTVVFVFIQVSSVMTFLENLSVNLISSLGVVMLITFVVRIVIRHRARPFDKIMNNCCWIIGCITAVIAQINAPKNPAYSFLKGIGASAFAFLLLIFIEETVWAASKVFKEGLKRRANIKKNCDLK